MARALHHPVSLASAAALLAALSGCMVGPDFQKPAAETPQTWAGLTRESPAPIESTPTADAAQIAAYWTQFNDPVLTDLVQNAASGNLGLAQADTRVRQARAARTVAASGLYPSADASAGISRSGSRGSARNLFRDGLDASWEIDVFGGTRRSVEAAEASLDATVLDREALLVSLVGEVASTYLDLRGSQRQLQIARRNLVAQQQTLDLTKERFEAGFVSALDVANARAQVNQTASQIPSFIAQTRASIFALSVLLGHEPAALLDELSPEAPVPTPPDAVPTGLPSDLLVRRPDIRRAEADLHAATARVGVAVADQFPRFSLTGSFGLQGGRVASLGTLADRVWSFGPAVSLPLFTGGRIDANIESAKAATDGAVLAYRQSVLTALQDVETALVAFTSEQARRASLRETLAANREAVDLALQLYSAGRTDFLNVLSAQRQLFASEASLSQSDTNVSSNLVALYKALGGGWASNGATPAPAAPSGTPEPTQPKLLLDRQ